MEEAIIVAFRRHTLLPLDDCLYSLQATIPHLSRSSLHRVLLETMFPSLGGGYPRRGPEGRKRAKACLQRHGISRLPEVAGDKPSKKKFKRYSIGYFHIDIAGVCTQEGNLYLFVAIDRTSKFAFVQRVKKAEKMAAAAFLHDLIKAVRSMTLITD